MSDEQFNLTEQLKIFHNNSLADLQIGFNEENIHSELYEVTDTITLHSSISLGNPNENDWEKFTSIAYYFILLQQKQKLALMNGLKTSIINSCKEINFFYNQMNKDVERDENDLLERKEQEANLKTGLKLLGYMVMVCLSTSFQQASNKKGDKQLLDETVSSFQTFLPCLLDLFEINLSRLFPTSTEKSEFIQLFSKSCFSFLEIESIFKISFLKDLLHKIFCLLVKLQNEKANVLNMVTSNVAYYTFSINFYAEFLKQLYDEYDYPQFAEDVLRELSEKEFNPKDITGPKNVALFLVKVSELVPQIMMKQIQLVTKLLNNSSFTLRNAVVEACGNIVYTYYKKKATTNDSILIESEEEQCSLLIDLLEDRLLDTNPYVRSKAVQGLIKLANLKTPSSSSSSSSSSSAPSFNENNPGEENTSSLNILPFQRRKVLWTQIAVRSLQDRSYLVRRYCIKLISIILLNHPFSKLHGSQLKKTEWEKRLKDTEDAYEKLSDALNMSDNEENGQDQQPDRFASLEEALGKLKLTIQYDKDALEYINLLNKAVEQCCKLISSKNKSEVIEAMDFFVLSDAYDLETSYLGIKKMLHLIWHQTDDMPKLSGVSNVITKNTGISNINIPQHLVTCYKSLFLTAPEDCSSKEKAAYIAKNLINLTTNASISDLASLEKILALLYREKVIDSNVIKVLWIIYNSFQKQKENTVFTEAQIHGSIIIIGMLSGEDNKIALDEIDNLLNVGLINNSNDYILAKYTCIALMKVLPGNIVKSLSNNTTNEKLDSEKISISLQNKLIEYTEDPNFYPFAECAIECLFKLSDLPDLYCKNVIELKLKESFASTDLVDENFSRIASISQLLFIVGEVVLKLIVYLEHSEVQFKRIKNQKETDAKLNKDKEKENELEMISKTTEDDFNDSIAYIRETELLFSPQSLLSQFIPFVVNLLTEYEYTFRNFFIQRIATLTLLKFMLTSKKVCETHLSLLITIMEKSEDPITRSNCILGFGDISVTFNTIIDDNIEFLYNRLMDDDLSVKRTCLMTITFLILAGQVKIKGQLGKMALCLVDKDLKIVQLSKIFFNELSSKDNAVYNGFLDIFNYLSNVVDLNESDFQKIVKFLMNYIQQEKYQKNINNKLISKLKTVENEKQYDDILYVLQNLINNKDENLDQIIEQGFKKVP
ncbi:hypothetical protein ACO0SA_001066 [Hanseniaspora valbyensis]